MKKNHTIRNLILFILIFGILGGGGYYYFFMRDNNEGGIIENILKISDDNNDVKNGIYVYKDKLATSTNVYTGCIVSSIDDYIVVINEKYYRYHGTCMIMNYLGTGETDKLKFNKEKDKLYTVELDNKIYNKDNNVREIITGNNISFKISRASYNLVNYIIKNTETEGNYYSFNVSLTNSTYGYNLDLEYDKQNNTFRYLINNKDTLYNQTFTSTKDFPVLYFINNNLVVVEKKFVNNIHTSNISIYNEANKTYEFINSLPLKVNGEVIDLSYNTLIRYDELNKVFYVVFSRDNTFCNTQSNIMYYEFKLKYDYKTKGLGIPEFVKKAVGDKSKSEDNEDCKYINKYFLKEG